MISEKNIDVLTSYLNDYWVEYIKNFIRPDIVIKDNGHKFVEFNITAAIAGAGICDIHILDFMRISGVSVNKLREMNLRTEPLALKWVNHLLSILLDTKKRPATFPVFCSAVYDSSFNLEDDFTLIDFRDLLQKFGFKYIIAPINEIEVTQHGVYYKNDEIDIFFTDFTYSQYLEKHDTFAEISKFIQAHEAGLVMFASPPGSMLFDNKAILSFLCRGK